MKYFIASAFDFSLSLTRKLITLAVISAMIFPDVARAVKPGETTADSTRPSISVPKRSPDSRSRGLRTETSSSATNLLKTPSSREPRSPHALATTPPKAESADKLSPSSPDDSESTHSSSLEDTPPNTKESVGAPKPVVAARSISSTTTRTVLVRGASRTSLHLGDALNLLHESSAVELTALKAGAGTALGDGAPVGQENVAPGHSSESKEEANAFAAEGKTHVGVTGNVYVKVQDEAKDEGAETDTNGVRPTDTPENSATGRSWVPAWVHYVVSAIAGVCSTRHSQYGTVPDPQEIDARLEQLEGDPHASLLMDAAEEANLAHTVTVEEQDTLELVEDRAVREAIAKTMHRTFPNLSWWKKTLLVASSLIIAGLTGIGMSTIAGHDIIQTPTIGHEIAYNLAAAVSVQTIYATFFALPTLFQVTSTFTQSLTPTSTREIEILKHQSRLQEYSEKLLKLLLSAAGGGLWAGYSFSLLYATAKQDAQEGQDDSPFLKLDIVVLPALLISGGAYVLKGINACIKAINEWYTERAFHRTGLEEAREKKLKIIETLYLLARETRSPDLIKKLYENIVENSSGTKIINTLEEIYTVDYPLSESHGAIETIITNHHQINRRSMITAAITTGAATVGRSIIFGGMVNKIGEAIGGDKIVEDMSFKILGTGILGMGISAGALAVAEFFTANELTRYVIEKSYLNSKNNNIPAVKLYAGAGRAMLKYPISLIITSISSLVVAGPYLWAGLKEMNDWPIFIVVPVTLAFVLADTISNIIDSKDIRSWLLYLGKKLLTFCKCRTSDIENKRMELTEALERLIHTYRVAAPEHFSLKPSLITTIPNPQNRLLPAKVGSN